ncbi:unnamed protein product [Peniophora sp. CBMAI 1063]|nr:unnamed protein product [Peniophora sp. CBMAI 1063]
MPSSLKRSAEEAGLDEHIPRPPNRFMVLLSCARYALKGTSPRGSQVWNARTFMEQNPDLHEWLQQLQTTECITKELSIQDYNSRISEIWGQFGVEQKRPFEEEAERCKERHRELYPDYVFRPKKKVKAAAPAVVKPKRTRATTSKNRSKASASSSPASIASTPSTASTSSSSPSFSPDVALATPTVPHHFGDLPVIPSVFDYGTGSTTYHPAMAPGYSYAQGTSCSSFGYGLGMMGATPSQPMLELYSTYYDPQHYHYTTQQLQPADTAADCWGSSSATAAPLPPTNFVGEEGSRALLGNSQYDYSPQGLAPLLDFNGMETFQDGLTAELGVNLLGLDLGLSCEGLPDPMAGSLFDDIASVGANFGSSFSAKADTSAWDACWSRSPVMHAASSSPTGC